MNYKKIQILCFIIFFCMTSISQADAVDRYSGYKVPRFVSLKNSSVISRYGPGKKYPIKKKITQKHIPLKIEKEFYGWYYVSNMSGEYFWIHRSQLSGTRYGVIKRQVYLKDSKRKDSKKIFTLKKNDIIRILKCNDSNFCKISDIKTKGYIERSAIYGILKDEFFE